MVRKVISMEGKVKYKGTDIHYRAEGEGPVLVLLHGFLEDLRIWDRFFEEYKGEFRLVAVDLPGHGQTDVVGPIHSMDKLATAVDKVLVELSIDKCVMIGHSMGGYVTLSYFRKYPDKIAGLGLFHSHAAEDTPQQKVNRNRAIDIIIDYKKDFIFQFIPDLFAPENVGRFQAEIRAMRETAYHMDKRSIIAALEGMKLRIDNRPLLRGANIPVLFIAGRKDPRIPVEQIMEQASGITDADVVVLEDSGHMGYLEEAKTCLDSIRSFTWKCYS